MEIEEIKRSITSFEVKKFEHILSLCQSPLEIKFLSNLYWFFLKFGFSISLEDIRPLDVESWNDEKLLKLWRLIENNEAANFTKIIPDPLFGNSTILCGFQVRCADVIYRVFPQYPVYDVDQVRYADFVVEVRSFDWKHLADFVVECDGFAYHSSKQQLINDNRRTRFLIKHGFTTIRYTGREINNIDERFFLNFENTIYHSIFKKESNLYKLQTY